MATALLNGTILDDGGLDCEGRFEYGFTPAFGFATTWRNNLRTGDTFQERIRNLPGGTTVYFQAQARNAMGVTVGTTLTFITLPGVPVVITVAANLLNTSSARLNGQVIDDMGFGCETCFEYGGTTKYGSKTRWVSGAVTGSTFNDIAYGLSQGSGFNFRALARNKYGVGYGQNMSFNTLSDRGGMSGFPMEYLLLREEL